MVRVFLPTLGREGTNVVPIQEGSVESIYCLGEATLLLSFGSKAVAQKAVVIDTSAFQAVLGTDFLSNPRVGGLITQPPPTSPFVDLVLNNP